ncbi:hypothetical protein GCM10009821_25110 [Aeromicrobium halocynthiae]|uniref:Transmembrane protein n=1 Tax=Aeromicrobium halocynthiae TaxID=560557 RepID=A0ABN2W3V9_9ACTN
MSENADLEQPVEDEKPPRRAVIAWSAGGAVAIVALVTLGATALAALPAGLGVTLTYVVVLVGVYALHVWLCGWRVLVGALLAVPGLLLSGLALVGAQELDRDSDTVVVVLAALLAGLVGWGTCALAVAIRNRWGNNSFADWHLSFPDF